MTMNGRLIMKTTMNKHVILLSAAVVLLFSCTRESDQVIQPGETITFTAAWAGSDETRTILQSDGTSVWWESGAQINVFFSDKASGRFTSTNNQSQAIVDFQGSLPIVVGSVETENPAHAYWAVYPYNAANTCDGESVTLTVPSAQTAAEGTFANKMFPSIATSTNFHLAFYNICGGVRFTVANEGISSITFKANNDESLVGKVQVGFDGVPVVQNVIEGNSEVVVNAPTGGFVPGQYYFAAFLPQTLSKGVSLTFKRTDGKVASTSLNQSITINRSRFGKMDEKDNGLEFKDDGSGHDPTESIVFADSKVKDRLVAKFDTNGDGELSYAEAAAVTSIEGALTIKTITSFDEFQFFTGVTSIPDSYFENWTKLESIVLPTGITMIGKSAFKNCPLISTINIPANVSFIGSSAFDGCSALSSPIVLNSISSLEDYVFNGCSSLYSISVHDDVGYIGKAAFNGCEKLKDFIIPKNVKSIGQWAFSGCASLTSITIPSLVSSIRSDSFLGCSGLLSINVEKDNPIFDSRDGCNAIIKTMDGSLILGCRNTIIPSGVSIIGDSAFHSCYGLMSISIPESVVSIGSSAFLGCTSLTSLIIPESVTKIGSFAFCECENLYSIVIPESIISIENNTFANCGSLVSIEIPESVVTIGNNAFSSCSSLVSIVIPQSVNSIGAWCFPFCSSLISMTVKATEPPRVGGYIFNGTDNVTVYVPAGSVDAYKEQWYFCADIIRAIPE